MKDRETWDDRYDLINHPYLHYGISVPTVPFTPSVDSGACVILTATTVNLPPAGDNKGKAFYIKNTGVGAVTINAAAGDLIDGATFQTLADQYDVMLLISDGRPGDSATTNWWILSSSDL